MPVLTNIREEVRSGQPMCAADFTLADGRVGSLAVPQGPYAEQQLEQEAVACEEGAAAHGYRAPGCDRRDELNR